MGNHLESRDWQEKLGSQQRDRNSKAGALLQPGRIHHIRVEKVGQEGC